MIQEKNKRSWKEITDIGHLVPGINSAEQYNRKMFENMSDIKRTLNKENKPYLTSEDIKNVHKQMFEGITTFGGDKAKTLRVFGGRTGADPIFIDNELKLLDKQMEHLWAKATSDSDKVKALAFQHARLVSIHGFQDGNGRTSRIATSYGLEKIGGSQKLNIDRTQYLAANNNALDENLGQLSAHFASSYGIEYKGSSVEFSEFRITPLRETMPAIDSALEITKTKSISNGENKKIFLKDVDFDGLINRLGGKRTSKIEKARQEFSQAISSPQSPNDVIDTIVKVRDSNAVKSGFFKKVNEDEYIKLSLKALTSVSDSLRPEKKAEFAFMVKQRFEGKQMNINEFINKNSYKFDFKKGNSVTIKESKDIRMTSTLKESQKNSQKKTLTSGPVR